MYAEITFMFALWPSLNADTRTFYGNQQTAFAQYPSWNATWNGSLQLKFKTHQTDALLVYIDDHLNKQGNGNYMKLEVQNKRLQLRVQVSYYTSRDRYNAQTHTGMRRLNGTVDDNHYHHVQVTRKGFEMRFLLDGEEEEVINITEHLIYLNSSVYLGGVPSIQRVFSDDDVIYKTRLIGCVTEFKYHDGKDVPNKAQHPENEHGTKKGCQNACLTHEVLSCLNQGRCLNRYVETGCDCRGTGYTGKMCEKSLSSIQLTGFDYLLWRPKHALNGYFTEFFLRFKSAEKSGILLFARGENFKDGYILLELYEKSLQLSFKTKDTAEEVITLGDHSINETVWRYVRVAKNGKSISLKLDDGKSVRRYLKDIHQYHQDEFGHLEITQVFVGGVIESKSLVQSKSKKLFNGCMQDVIISQFNIVDAVLDGDNESITKVGNIMEGCGPFLYPDDFDVSVKNWPSLETEVKKEDGTEVKVEDSTTPKFIKDKGENKNNESGGNLAWIVTGACCGLLLITLVVVFIARRFYVANRLEQKQIRAHLMHQKMIEEDLPITPSSRSNRMKRRPCELQTFSPLRKAFYVSSSEVEMLRKDVNFI